MSIRIFIISTLIWITYGSSKTKAWFWCRYTGKNVIERMFLWLEFGRVQVVMKSRHAHYELHLRNFLFSECLYCQFADMLGIIIAASHQFCKKSSWETENQVKFVRGMIDQLFDFDAQKFNVDSRKNCQRIGRTGKLNHSKRQQTDMWIENSLQTVQKCSIFRNCPSQVFASDDECLAISWVKDLKVSVNKRWKSGQAI